MSFARHLSNNLQVGYLRIQRQNSENVKYVQHQQKSIQIWKCERPNNCWMLWPNEKQRTICRLSPGMKMVSNYCNPNKIKRASDSMCDSLECRETCAQCILVTTFPQLLLESRVLFVMLLCHFHLRGTPARLAKLICHFTEKAKKQNIAVCKKWILRTWGKGLSSLALNALCIYERKIHNYLVSSYSAAKFRSSILSWYVSKWHHGGQASRRTRSLQELDVNLSINFQRCCIVWIYPSLALEASEWGNSNTCTYVYQMRFS